VSVDRERERERERERDLHNFFKDQICHIRSCHPKPFTHYDLKKENVERLMNLIDKSCINRSLSSD
jgi:hypothetical protein